MTIDPINQTILAISLGQWVKFNWKPYGRTPQPRQSSYSLKFLILLLVVLDGGGE